MNNRGDVIKWANDEVVMGQEHALSAGMFPQRLQASPTSPDLVLIYIFLISKSKRLMKTYQ